MTKVLWKDMLLLSDSWHTSRTAYVKDMLLLSDSWHTSRTAYIQNLGISNIGTSESQRIHLFIYNIGNMCSSRSSRAFSDSVMIRQLNIVVYFSLNISRSKANYLTDRNSLLVQHPVGSPEQAFINDYFITTATN